MDSVHVQTFVVAASTPTSRYRQSDTFGQLRCVAMSLLARVESDRNAARRARDGEAVTSLGMLLAALQDATKVGGPLSETEEIALLKRERKRRVEASEAFRAGGRLDQAAQEDRELEIIDGYLPAALSDRGSRRRSSMRRSPRRPRRPCAISAP